MLSELGGRARIASTARIDAIDQIPAVALRVVKSDPDAVVNLLINGQAGLFARELRKLGYSGEIFGTIVYTDKEEIKLAEEALTGAEYPDVVPTQDFIRSFESRYQFTPGLGAHNGYDIAKLIHEALNELGTLHNRPVLAEFIRTHSCEGALGRYHYEDRDTSSFSLSARLVKLTENS